MNRIAFIIVLAAALFAPASAPAAAQGENVTRATLPNGLQVVVVHDPLAPVVTAVMNYRVGSNEEQYPGQAHALEHMMFRGTPAITQTQLFEIGQLMGGDYDADTQSEVTQFFFSVPAQYLDVALRTEADRARHLSLKQTGWLAERGAIEQEVRQDDSVPISKLFTRTILPAIFKGTPYAKDTLGTIASFNNEINSRTLRSFYESWYKPDNAIYVITGNVDGPSVIAKVRQDFGAIPSAPLPPKPAVHLQPVHPATYRVTSDQPYTIVAMSFRFPGWSDPDYAAAQIAEAVLNDQRAALFDLTVSGKAFAAGFQDIQAHAHGTAAGAFSIVPTTTPPETALADLRGVLAGYLKSGLPADLIAVEKQRAIADAEFRANSIQGLALEWSDALAVRGESSPDAELAQIRKVTPADVDRVLRKYLTLNDAIVAYAVPKPGGAPSMGASSLAQENNTFTPEKSQPLPAWAQAAFRSVRVPAQTTNPVETTLSNGMHLIVQTERVTPTVEVYGNIKSNEGVQAPASEQGVADIVSGLFPFGTQQYGRIELRRQLDAIAADVTAGTEFSLRVVNGHFDRGVALLADEELHPALPAQAFAVVKQQEVQELTGEMTSPDYLTQVALDKALLPAADPLRRLSTPQTAGTVTLDDVRAYYSSVYRPDMTSVVVIGDVTPQQARGAFERYFGSWSASGPKPQVALPPVPRNASSSVVVPDPSRVQSEVQLAQIFNLRRSDPDWDLLAVGNNILGGGGFGSILMDDLRVVHGYVYNAGSSFDSSKNRTTFTIDYACDPDKIVPAERLALTDLAHLESGTIDAARLQRSKTMLMSDVPLRVQSYGGTANTLLNYATLGLPLNQMTIDAQRELAATPLSVQAALKRWIDAADFVRVVEGPGPK
jgi:zinc protease